MDELAIRVQNLPPELYNQIYADVFVADASVQTIAWAYKPPNRLAVDRRSRALFARSYYGFKTTFKALRKIDKPNPSIQWLKSLPKEYIRFLHELRIVHEADVSAGAYEATIQNKPNYIDYVRRCMVQELVFHSVEIDRDVVQVEIELVNIDDKEEKCILRS